MPASHIYLDPTLLPQRSGLVITRGIGSGRQGEMGRLTVNANTISGTAPYQPNKKSEWMTKVVWVEGRFIPATREARKTRCLML